MVHFKKYILSGLTGCFLFLLCACNSAGNSDSQGNMIDSTTAVSESTGITGTEDEFQESSIPSEESGTTEENSVEDTKIGVLNLQIGDTQLTADLVENSSTEALQELLADGPLTLELQDYGNMEKVGSLGAELPRNDEQITTEPGDLILYQGNAFVIYYAPNSWNFTRLGKIRDTSEEELRELLGDGNVTVTLSISVRSMAGQSNTAERLSLQNTTVETQERKDNVMEYRNVSYDTEYSDQNYDLFLPEEGEGPFPLVVFIHGGGWYSGDKTDGQEDAWMKLLDYGYAVASLNYRLSGEAPHPAGIIDCKTALRHLQANAGEYRIDPERIAVAGDSSGGHYALMLALTEGNPELEDLARGNRDQEVKIRCAVAWYPATDLVETMRTVQEGEYTGFGAEFAWENIERYIGKSITDTSDESLVLASPIHYVSENMPPILLQHGNADTICPMDQSRRFYNAAVQETGDNRVIFEILEGATHGDDAFETDENMERIAAFLDENMK